MLRRHTLGPCLAALAGALLLAGCGEDKDKENAGKACGPAPAAMSGAPQLPNGFPDVEGVTYAKDTQDGPSEIVEGFREGTVGDAFDAYESALTGAKGYTVTKDEHEEDDAEINFDAGDKTGQVKLVQSCEDRTGITITARPK